MPPGLAAVMSTVPVPAGAVADRTVPLVTVIEEAGVAPKLTATPATKPLPDTVTTVPPASGPAAGETPVMLGTGS